MTESSQVVDLIGYPDRPESSWRSPEVLNALSQMPES
jgi:hypothetical protein